MSIRGEGPTEPEGFDERELIDAEFESIVSGLSLDESSPTTYLDDLDTIEKSQEREKFIPPIPPKISFKKFIKDSSISFRAWKNRKDSSGGADGDGAII